MSEIAQKATIVIGADHGGFANKQVLVEWLVKQHYQVKDCGSFTLDPDDDYPVFAKAVVKELLSQTQQAQTAVGVLLCRSGAGMTMMANRYLQVRAASVTSIEQAVHARAHNDANSIVMSGDWMDIELIKQCLESFLQTPFSGEPRHIRRIKQLDSLDYPPR